ncbi:MAG: type II secretion system protein GspM [Blastomonas sp.]
MSGSLKDWFLGLSRREKILIGILLVLLAGVITYYGIYRPLYDSATAARVRFNDATLQEGRIAAKVDALKGPASQNRPTVADALNLFIAGEAGERGFTLERNQPQGDDRIDIVIASARSTALLGWLAELEGRGIIVEQLTTRRLDSGAISVTATLAKAGS